MNKEMLNNMTEKEIEEALLNRAIALDENIPMSFQVRHPELFLDSTAPEELKEYYYEHHRIGRDVLDMKILDFSAMKHHPEWREYLKGKNLKRVFPRKYEKLFKLLDIQATIKLGTRSLEIVEKMVELHEEELLKSWYQSTGERFVPHYVVMLNMPEEEMDNYNRNSKQWSMISRIENYNESEEDKLNMLKLAYTMGVFHDDSSAVGKIMKIFTDIPKEMSQEQHEKIKEYLSNEVNETNRWHDDYLESMEINNEIEAIFDKAYAQTEEGKYVLKLDKQKNKKNVKKIRTLLEKAEFPTILNLKKARKLLRNLKMQYNPEFATFFSENLEEIISNPEAIEQIGRVQKEFSGIKAHNAAKGLTLQRTLDYIESNSLAYENVDIGNERVAQTVKKEGYSQAYFEQLQQLYNEGEKREYSSIPRVEGENQGFTYEMLRLDDPLALTIGNVTDCCQVIEEQGESCMMHSVLSEDGRIFCVKDPEGRIVAQSWVWRNQKTVCFDNIEIPKRIFNQYEKEYPEIGREGLANQVLEVYKQASIELVKEDEKTYQEMLEQGYITKNQYEALVLNRVTIGAGYNDVREALNQKYEQGEFGLDRSNNTLPLDDRFHSLYTDALYVDAGNFSDQYGGQFVVVGEEESKTPNRKPLAIYEDDVPEYEEGALPNVEQLSIRRMKEAEEGKDYEPEEITDKVLKTPRMALIYTQEGGKVKIKDLVTAPANDDEEKEIRIVNQIRKALKQLGSKIDLSELNEEKRRQIAPILGEIEEEER